jgi:hypothetical protein
MVNEHAARAASQMSDYALFHVARTLNSEIEAAMSSSCPYVQRAALGKLELVTACTAELVTRGYERGHKVDGSDIPHDVAIEHAYGTAYRLATPVRVF